MPLVINLSTLLFTNKVDIIPLLGTAEIVNTGIANTLAEKDRITGTSINGIGIDTRIGDDYGIYNQGFIYTGAGNDLITGTVSGGTGVYGIYNQGTINTGSGKDIITGNGNYGNGLFFTVANTPPKPIIGTNKDDILNGTPGNDLIQGLNGQDCIHGLEGDDTLEGGNGKDILYGGTGNDSLSGGNGADVLVGVDPNSYVNTITVSAFAQSRSDNAVFPFFFTFSFPDNPGTSAGAGAVSIADTFVGLADARAFSEARRDSDSSLFFSTQEQQKLLRRAQGALQTVAITNAAAAPNTFENPSPPNSVDGGNPLTIGKDFESDINTTLTISFNSNTHLVSFDFSGGASLRTTGPFDFSTGIRLESKELGVLRSFDIRNSSDEDDGFKLDFQGGWGKGDLLITEENDITFNAGFDNLDFVVPVPSGFTEADFRNLDFRFNGASTAPSVSEPLTIGAKVSEVDTLTGGNGPDTFVLGDKNHVYYANGGNNDYTLITDFTKEDTIQLKGKANDYSLVPNFTLGSSIGTALVLKGIAGDSNELIGLIQGLSEVNLNTKAFSYV